MTCWAFRKRRLVSIRSRIGASTPLDRSYARPREASAPASFASDSVRFASSRLCAAFLSVCNPSAQSTKSPKYSRTRLSRWRSRVVTLASSTLSAPVSSSKGVLPCTAERKASALKFGSVGMIEGITIAGVFGVASSPSPPTSAPLTSSTMVSPSLSETSAPLGLRFALSEFENVRLRCPPMPGL